jgi:hypothetical protein
VEERLVRVGEWLSVRVCVRLQLDWVTILLLVYIGHSAGLCGSSDLKVKFSLPRASAIVRRVLRNSTVSGAVRASEYQAGKMTEPTLCETRWKEIVASFERNHENLTTDNSDCQEEIDLLGNGLRTIENLEESSLLGCGTV